MEHLTKQQIVLLTLLVSFMTSLSTGIVTVSLMDQAPQGVTRTINQVIEKTIQQAAPQSAAVGTVSVSVDDAVANAAATASKSLVRIQDKATGAIIGLGVVVSSDGKILTASSLAPASADRMALFADGSSAMLSPISSQPGGDLILLAPNFLAGAAKPTFAPVAFAASSNLGQTILALSGTSTNVLGQGRIAELAPGAIGTSIAASQADTGSPLIDLQGALLGIRTAAAATVTIDAGGAAFSLAAPVEALVQ